MLSSRYANFIGAITCFSLIAVAYFYMENVLYLNPCPLCYAQRIVFGITGFFFLLAFVFSKCDVAKKILGIVITLCSLGGAALSIRHIYLQNVPKDEIPSCGQDFYSLVENTPLAEAVQTMITGTGDCAEVQWTFLGVSIPGWTLVMFICMALWALFFNIMKRNKA